MKKTFCFFLKLRQAFLKENNNNNNKKQQNETKQNEKKKFKRAVLG